MTAKRKGKRQPVPDRAGSRYESGGYPWIVLACGHRMVWWLDRLDVPPCAECHPAPVPAR